MSRAAAATASRVARRARVALAALCVLLGACVSNAPWPLWQKLTLPLRGDSVRFAVIGDSGTGGRQQYEVAARMADFHERYPFDFVIMLGDNMYGGEEPEDFDEKFTRPYKTLLDEGVLFYAALGNHDLAAQEMQFEPFHMGGKRYYTFVKGPAQFFALDSNYMDPAQLEWLTMELGASVESALGNMEKRMGSTDLRLLIMVITIQHSVGGDLPAILTTLADTMRQRREMREEVMAATAQSRASALIITLLPIAVAVFGYFVLPDYFRPLFTNPVGWLIVVIAAVLLTSGTLIIRRMTKIE